MATSNLKTASYPPPDQRGNQRAPQHLQRGRSQKYYTAQQQQMPMQMQPHKSHSSQPQSHSSQPQSQSQYTSGHTITARNQHKNKNSNTNNNGVNVSMGLVGTNPLQVGAVPRTMHSFSAGSVSNSSGSGSGSNANQKSSFGLRRNRQPGRQPAQQEPLGLGIAGCGIDGRFLGR